MTRSDSRLDPRACARVAGPERPFPPAGVPAMPNTNATLDVRNFPSNGSDGYTNTTATNNAIYSYKYSGGTDNAGGMDVKVGQGVATLNLSLDSDNRYSIDGVN